MTEARTTIPDWTVGPDGKSNTSAAFEDAVLVVSSLLRNHRLGDDVPSTARLIMAQLAHNHGFAPVRGNINSVEQLRLARSLRGKFVRFNHEHPICGGYLVTFVNETDGLIELQGWTGQFAPHLFVRVDRPHSAAEGNC